MLGRGHYDGQIAAFSVTNESGKRLGVRFERWSESAYEWADVPPEELQDALTQYVAGSVIRTLRTLVRSYWCDTCACHSCSHKAAA